MNADYHRLLEILEDMARIIKRRRQGTITQIEIKNQEEEFIKKVDAEVSKQRGVKK